MPKARILGIYLQSPIRLHDVMLHCSSTESTLRLLVVKITDFRICYFFREGVCSALTYLSSDLVDHCSNLDRDIDYAGWGFRGFPQSIRPNARVVSHRFPPNPFQFTVTIVHSVDAIHQGCPNLLNVAAGWDSFQKFGAANRRRLVGASVQVEASKAEGFYIL
jgi:hypothetical protein